MVSARGDLDSLQSNPTDHTNTAASLRAAFSSASILSRYSVEARHKSQQVWSMRDPIEALEFGVMHVTSLQSGRPICAKCIFTATSLSAVVNCVDKYAVEVRL